jgi:superfamily II DNA or RNA helicase
MLKEGQWSEDRSYRTGSEDEPFDFYLNGLNNSKSIDLLLGYFSSGAINLLSLGFAKFIHNGGILRIVLNDVLSEKDKIAIKSGQEEIVNAPIDLSNLKQLTESLNDYGKHFFQCLAYLIAQDRIQIKIVKPKGRKGIVHYKSGVFSDGIDEVAFKASCNFTAYGLLENLEELDTFIGWDDSQSAKRIAKQKKDFEDIFSGKSDLVEYLNIEEVRVAITNEFGDPDINELLIQEDELMQKKQQLLENKNLKKTLKKINQEIEVVLKEPRFPYPSGPREYQIEAYNNWVANGKKGIFAMATGTGKTITSLNCLFEIYKNVGNYKALILVPTMSLVEQWKKECSQFNFTENIVSVYSLNNWQGELSRLQTKKLLNKNFSYIIIATYASFLTKKFQGQLKELDEETLLIADECHNMGSPSILNKFKSFHLKNRIGLSATPERQYQEEVNNKIRDFFGETPENEYTFSYSMEDAIKKKPRALCPYRYFPKIVRLTDSEFNKYIEFTKRIVAMNPKNEDEKEIFNRLCIARQRIIHKATNKLEVFKSILLEEYSKRKNLKYTLVYVPEGLADEDVMFDPTKTDILKETDSDFNLLNKYTKMIGELFENVTVEQFTGRTTSENRNRILNNFAQGDLQVITSMKCLDEGIDVPRSELAIFCASTGNPRQFIQRRGRVLRLAEGKEEAVIYDLVVIPNSSGDSSVFKTEQGEVEKELRRVRDFAEMSENKHFTRQILDPILKYYQLTL